MALPDTFEQVAELMERLSLQDQQRLKQQIDERLRRQAYAARVAAFIEICSVKPVSGDIAFITIDVYLPLERYQLFFCSMNAMNPVNARPADAAA